LNMPRLMVSMIDWGCMARLTARLTSHLSKGALAVFISTYVMLMGPAQCMVRLSISLSSCKASATVRLSIEWLLVRICPALKAAITRPESVMMKCFMPSMKGRPFLK